MRELERGRALQEHVARKEGLAPLEPKIQRVVAEIFRQEAGRDDLSGRSQRIGSLEILKIVLVGIVADRKDAAEVPGQVARGVVEADLPSRLRLRALHEDARAAVGEDAEIRGVRRSSGDTNVGLR